MDTSSYSFTDNIDARIQNAADKCECSPVLLVMVYQAIPRGDQLQPVVSGSTFAELNKILKGLLHQSSYLDQSKLKQGGAKAQLASLSVRSFQDIANALKALVDEGLVNCAPEFFEEIPNKVVYEMTLMGLFEKVESRWDLTSMFVWITFAAVALAGFRSKVKDGVIYTMFAALLIYIGVVVVRSSKRFESRLPKLSGILVGIVMMLVGICIFWYVITV